MICSGQQTPSRQKKRSITALLDEEDTLDMEMGGLEEHVDKSWGCKERQFVDISFTNTWGEFEVNNFWIKKDELEEDGEAN